MEYFNELLDSYDKLKKRKFKIIYESGTAEILAQNLINQAKSGQAKVPIPGKSGWVNSTKSGPNQGNITFFHPGFGRQLTIVDRTGQTANYQQFLTYLSSEEEGNKNQGPEVEVPVLPTTTLEQYLPPEWTENTKAGFAKLTSELTDICDKLRDPLLCSHIEDYIAVSPTSLASKLLNSVTILRDSETGLEKGRIKDTIDSGLVEDVIGSLVDLIKTVNKPDELNCNRLNSLISFNGNRMTIISKSGEEGLVLAAGDRFLSTLKKLVPNKSCKGYNFSTALFKKRQNKSVLVGAFNERLVEFSLALALAGDNHNATFTAKKRIVEAIEGARADLDGVLMEYKGSKEDTYSVEAYTEQLDNLELAGLLKTESLRKHIGSRMLMIKNTFHEFFLKNKITGNFISISNIQRTGSRADGLFLIKDEKQAKKLSEFVTGQDPIQTSMAELSGEYGQEFNSLAQSYGMDPTSSEPIYSIHLGIKAYDDNPKLGEINKYSRLLALMTGQTSLQDKSLKPVFLNKIDRILNIEPDTFANYNTSIMEAADDRVKFVLNGAAYRDAKGGLKEIKQDDIIKYLRSKLGMDMTYEKRLHSALAGLLGDKDTNFDLTVEENVQRLSELIKRHTILHTLSKDLAGEDKERSTLAKQSLLKMLYLTGGNYDPLGQVTVSDRGAKIFKHGKVMDDLIGDINKGKGRIVFDGAASRIRFFNDNKDEVNLIFEGTWAGKVREGRILSRFSTSSSKITNENTITKDTIASYISGQKVLLDELFKAITL